MEEFALWIKDSCKSLARFSQKLLWILLNGIERSKVLRSW